MRKVDKQAPVLVTETIPVTWILIGPGKYVRVEGGSPAAVQPRMSRTRDQILGIMVSHPLPSVWLRNQRPG